MLEEYFVIVPENNEAKIVAWTSTVKDVTSFSNLGKLNKCTELKQILFTFIEEKFVQNQLL